MGDVAERWLPIQGMEGRYEVSSLGRVRSLFHGSRWGRHRRPMPFVLAPTPNQQGYLRATLGRHEVHVFVHRLVLGAFVGPRPDGTETAHLDGDVANNAVENLAWCSPLENSSYKERHGTLLRGEQIHRAKLTEPLIREIRALHAEGATMKGIALRYGVRFQTISGIVHRRNWRHVA